MNVQYQRFITSPRCYLHLKDFSVLIYGFTGFRLAKAPDLNLIMYFSLVVHPSGKIIRGGAFPCSHSSYLFLILSNINYLFSLLFLDMNRVPTAVAIWPTEGTSLILSFEMKPGIGLTKRKVLNTSFQLL